MYWPKNQGFFRSRNNIAPGNPNCNKCGLYKNTITPRMKYTGEGKLGILIIGEAPGKIEDEKGTQFVGETGNFLRKILSEFGLDLDRDFYKTNSVCCRPPNNRDPSLKEISHCKPILNKTISDLKPKQIWLLGRIALQAMFGGAQSMSKWIREYIPDCENDYWIIPMYHPSFLKRREYDNGSMILFKQTIKKALYLLNKKIPNYKSRAENNIRLLTIPESIIDLLEGILKDKNTIVIDYETTGLDIYRGNHEVVAIGVKPDKDFSFSFPLNYPGILLKDEIEHITHLWKSILTNPKIKMIAHNLKYEDVCSRVIFGVTPRGWIHDTMISSHILNENPNTSGLKHQAFVKFGIKDYNSDIVKYIEMIGKDGRNNIKNAPIDLLLKYNALDVEITSMLYRKQNLRFKKIGELKKANKFFTMGCKSFCDVEFSGIHIDENYLNEMNKVLDNGIERSYRRFLKLSKNSIKEVEKKKKTKFNFQSNDHLKCLFFDVLGYKPTKQTKKGNDSIDYESLVEIGSPISESIVMIRKLTKIKNTFLKNIFDYCYDGKIHPSFNLHTTRTFRSSCDKPNLQNIPKQDDIAKRICRGGIIPRKGNKIAEVDYSSIEVRIAACETKDPVLINYIKDPYSDMHWDEAKEIFLVNDNLVDKENKKDLRYIAKNGYVFPEFYGSYYVSCARDIWDRISDNKIRVGNIGIIDHLRKKGIRSYNYFENHVKRVEDKFWKKFNVFKQWKDEKLDFYNRKGYVETLFGFRRYAPLDKEQIINTPIQATAFHCLLWSLTEMDKWISKSNLRTKIIGQIHDSILLDISPKEEDLVLKKIVEISCYNIRKRFDFLIVPLEVEIEITDIDGSWYDKKEVKNNYKETLDEKYRRDRF